MSFVDEGMVADIRKQMSQGGTRYLNAEFLTAYWITSKEAYLQHIPYPLSPIPDPIVVGFVADYPEVAGLFPYREYGLALVCRYRRHVGKYWLSMGLTDDIATVMGREIYGFPKKMAEIDFERSGNHVSGSGRRRGQEIFRMTAEFTEKPDNPDAAKMFDTYDLAGELPNYNIKELLSTSVTSLDYFPRLTSCQVAMDAHESSFAQVNLELFEHQYDPWHLLPIETMLGATYVNGDTILRAAKKLKRIGPFRVMSYLPHMRKKYDQGNS